MLTTGASTGTSTGTSTCTVVTCFYRFPSKHSDAEYDEWMARFLRAVDTPMVIFCEAEMAPRLRALRERDQQQQPIQTRVEVYPIVDNTCAAMVDWREQHAKDPERDTQAHSPALYTVWASKSAFVGRAMALNPFGTDAFAWCDIGCFRSDLNLGCFRRWPEGARLDALDPTRMVLECITPFQESDLVLDPGSGLPPSFAGQTRIAGAIMVGHRPAWERWIPAFYSTLQRMVANGQFVGVDQNVMAAVAVTRPDIVTIVTPSFLPQHGDPWFFLQPWFSAVIS